MAHLKQQQKTSGGIAQLVERCLCTAEASGSSPLTSSGKELFTHKRKIVQQLNWEQARETAGGKTSQNLENCIATLSHNQHEPMMPRASEVMSR